MNPARGTNEAFAATVADELARCGIHHVCISPGSRSGPLALAFEREPKLCTHVHLDERSAAFFALGVARATRRPAVVLCTSGTAAANLFPAIVEARQALVPMVVMTADRPPELRATGANQTIDQIKMFGDSVVWFAEAGIPDAAATSPGYWRSLVCRAVAESTESGGPVHVNVALREPLFPGGAGAPYPLATAGRGGGAPWTEVHAADAGVSQGAVDRLSRALAESERGVVVAGAVSADLSSLPDLAAAAGWPLLAEPASNIRVPGTIASYDALLRSDRFVATHRPDVVLRVGKLALGRPLARLLRDARQITIAPARTWWDEQRKTETRLVADPGVLCSRVVADLTPRTGTSWLRSWERHDGIARRAITEILDLHDAPSEPRTARDLAAALPDGANLFAAASMPIRDLDSFMVPRSGLTVYANRGANGIDGSISTALGVATATGAPTAALLGDLALLHDSNAMLCSDDDEVDMTIVVVNNDGGGIFSFLEQAGAPEFERVFGTPHGIDLQTWARLYGVPYTKLERASDLAGMVGGGRGRRMIEIETRRDDNVEIHRSIWRAVDAAVGSVG